MGFLSSLGSGIIGDVMSSFGLKSSGGMSSPTASAWDTLKNGNTNSVNYEIAQQNLAYQRENLEYQKALQQKIFDREDSAYQRTAKDMRAAGLSPLTMNGTNGAGEAIQTQPLHNDYQHQGAGFGDAITMLSQLQSVKRQQIDNDYAASTLEDRKTYQKAQALLADYDASDKRRKEKFNDFFGIYDDMTEKQKYYAIVSKMFGVDSSDPKNYTSENFNKVLGQFSSSVGDWAKSIFDSVSSSPLHSAVDDVVNSISSSLNDSVDDYIEKINPGYKKHKKAQDAAKKAQEKYAEEKKKNSSKPKNYVKNDDGFIMRWR